MLNIRNKSIGIGSVFLRIIGMIATIAAIIGFLKGQGYDWLENFSWFAFTIFAFLLVEGLRNTSSIRLYLRRFLLFTAIGEVCYDLFRTGWIWNNTRQSVMLTLFIGLILITLLKLLRDKLHNVILNGLAIAIAGIGGYFLLEWLRCDFGGYGIIIILTFNVASNVTYSKLFEIAVFLYLAIFISTQSVASITLFRMQYEISPLMYSVLALLPIWFYNGSRKTHPIIVRVCSYSFYPAVVLLFTLLRPLF